VSFSLSLETRGQYYKTVFAAVSLFSLSLVFACKA
jgi:hypothetical protein